MSDRFRKRIKELTEIEAAFKDCRNRILAMSSEYAEDVIAELHDLIEAVRAKAPVPQANEGGEEESEDRVAGGTVAQRMVAFFFKRSNQPASIQEIADGAGATADTVRSILYKPDRNKGLFAQSGPTGASGGHSLWKLVDVGGKPPLGPNGPVGTTGPTVASGIRHTIGPAFNKTEG